MPDYEDDKKSRFNAGVALTERIDSLQRAINAARFNPLATNPDTMTFNYEIMISANDGLLKESWSKLNKDERILGERLRKVIKQFIETCPPIKKTSEGIQVNRDNYRKFLELIDLYERIIKDFLDAHNLNSPDSEDDEGL